MWAKAVKILIIYRLIMNQASGQWLQVQSGGPYRATTRNWSICLLVRGHSGSHSFSSNLDWSLSSGSPAGRKEARAVTKHGSQALFTPGGSPTSRGLWMINFIFILAPFVEDLCHFYAGRVWGLFKSITQTMKWIVLVKCGQSTSANHADL